MSDWLSLAWDAVGTDLTSLLAAIAAAALIGFEREWRQHAAGLRTHILVSIGACLFTLLTRNILETFDQNEVQADPIRIVEAVTAGVAFLAAGAIIQGRGQVRGLTTGASLWVAGALGLACGLGNFLLAGLAAVVTLVILTLVKLLE